MTTTVHLPPTQGASTDALIGRPLDLTRPRRRLGDYLIDAQLLTPEQLDDALRRQKKWHSRLGDVVLASRLMSALQFYTVLAHHYELNFVNLMEHHPEEALFETEHIQDYLRHLVLPWRMQGDHVVLAVANPDQDTVDWAHDRYGDNVLFVGTGKFDIIWTLQEIGDEQLTDHALGALANLKPEQSARTVITKGQIVALCLMLLVVIIGMVLAPSKTLMVLGILMSLVFLISFGLKFLLAWQGSRHRIDVKVTDEDVAALSDKELPIYTILVPMYKEPEVLPILVNALRNLDYPQSRLDIKLVLEADDTETIDAAKAMGLESTFEIIRVPPSMPRTKPKACNYALQFARGELLTIYDAEDKPEPDQLKRVIAAFRKSSNDVACIQARLNYYNSDENWLTRMFTLEYTLWFDFYLPALEYLRIPIPLGGTSNHFLIDVLRNVQAWDPYNVTEDADLGVRLTQLDWRVGVVNSTTFEEANVSVTNWIRQRSRWLKGYMQTYLVHMRNPIKFYRMTGGTGFWGFQFFVGGTVLTPLLVPFTLIPYVVWLCTRTTMFDDLFPPFVMYTNLFTLLIGNGFFIYLTLLASFKRRYYRLAPYALTVPAYWLLQTIAAFKGLWQLISKPFYWEKTTHGISKQTKIEREAALDSQTPPTP